MLVIPPPIHQLAQSLEIPFGLVQRIFQRAGLLELVGAPVALVGEHKNAQGLVHAVGDGR